MRYLKQVGVEPGGLDFKRDIPFPEINLVIYNEIYYVEQWLRRILFFAMFFRYGPEWIRSIPPNIRTDLDKRRGYTNGKIHLDCENSSNSIWLTTLDELSQLITAQGLAPILDKLIRIPQDVLKQKINVLREVRNVIGHNRAATKNTWLLLGKAIETLNEGIRHFKNELYDGRNITEFFDTLDSTEESVYQESKAIFEYCASKPVPEKRRMILFGKEHFYELGSCLAEDPTLEDYRQNVNISRLLDEFEDLDARILAFRLSFKGLEFSVLWPKNVQNEIHFLIIDRFFKSQQNIWDGEQYGKQSPKYICDPKIWIYGPWDRDGHMPELK